MTQPEASMKTPTIQEPRVEEFDVVILGGGTGSTIAAWTFAGEGLRVAVIDRKYIGGSCPNIACLPSKNIIHSAKVAAYVRESEDFGIARRDFTVDMSVVRGRKRNMVSALNDVYLENYQKTGAELIFGSGRFVAPKTIEVTLRDGKTRQLRGTNVILSTGTHAAMGSIPGLAEAQPLTHVEALELDRVPEHLIVIGAGYIGLEFSQAMRRFGSKITMIEQGDRLLSREDEDVSATLRELFNAEGIELVMNAKVKRVSGKSGESVEIVIEKDGKAKTLRGTDILLALGRVPNTTDIGLETAGIEVTDTGYLKVNERLQTTAPGVWAIGEVAGSPLFTHVSIDDFRVVHSSITGGTRVTTGRVVPFCLFTDPEFARVGLSEKEAKARGLGYRLFKVPMEANLRARTLGETRGFMKALVELDSDRLLGFTIIGVGAGEIMTTVQIAMGALLPYTVLRDSILAHPTLVEGLGALFTSVPSTHHGAKGTGVSA
jgi:pyruvate/2-oxoglutarate dehydrogenase complex dihydrolipoamide dehydrogenase (E3) component